MLILVRKHNPFREGCSNINVELNASGTDCRSPGLHFWDGLVILAMEGCSFIQALFGEEYVLCLLHFVVRSRVIIVFSDFVC